MSGASSAGAEAELSRFLAELRPKIASLGLAPGALEWSVARAPGRLDVLGGFADYSGALTLEMPIAEGTFAAVAALSEPHLRLSSFSLADPTAPIRQASFDFGTAARALRTAEGTRRLVAQAGPWATYVAGALWPLCSDYEAHLPRGLAIAVGSRVPEGKGVSSSAAVEVATLSALAAHFGLRLSARQIAAACQRVENFVVGAPCGVMDQMTVSCGQQSALLPILCQPGEPLEPLPLPEGLCLWGIDSGVAHQVSGADYGQVRVAAFMGYRILAEELGLRVSPTAQPGRVEIELGSHGGYLANLGPEVAQAHAEHLPERLAGSEFLKRYEGISDPVTQVDEAVSYPVKAATLHPIAEHARTQEFRRLLEDPPSPSAFERMGALMSEAHAGYTQCGLGSQGTDELVEALQAGRGARGIFGSKITGGGSGGTVAVLGSPDAEPFVLEVARAYGARHDLSPYIFHGSSPGCAAFGVRPLQL